jgi:hypothetical protein
VLSARVMLTMATDPAAADPASARATVSVNGRLVRAHATAVTMSAAVAELTDRLSIRVGRAWPDERPRPRRPQKIRLRHRR